MHAYAHHTCMHAGNYLTSNGRDSLVKQFITGGDSRYILSSFTEIAYYMQEVIESRSGKHSCVSGPPKMVDMRGCVNIFSGVSLTTRTAMVIALRWPGSRASMSSVCVYTYLRKRTNAHSLVPPLPLLLLRTLIRTP